MSEHTYLDYLHEMNLRVLKKLKRKMYDLHKHQIYLNNRLNEIAMKDFREMMNNAS